MIRIRDGADHLPEVAGADSSSYPDPARPPARVATTSSSPPLSAEETTSPDVGSRMTRTSRRWSKSNIGSRDPATASNE